MVEILDIARWKRRKHFEYFKGFSHPFFNITANIDVSEIVRISRSKEISFFSISFFILLKCMNEVENFKLRIRDDDVVVHDVIHGGSTVLNDDETFSFCYFEYSEDFNQFRENIRAEIEANKLREGLEPGLDRDDLIHASVVPWVSFTGFEHAKNAELMDSIPKVVFGKYFSENDRTMMPVSVSVHHALADGFHIGVLFQKYAEFCTKIDNFV